MSLSLQKNSAGVAQTISRLRQEFGVKIGSSTGYTSEIMAELKVRGDIFNYPLSLYLPLPASCSRPGLQSWQLRDERHGEDRQAHPGHDLPQHGQHGRLPRPGGGEGGRHHQRDRGRAQRGLLDCGGGKNCNKTKTIIHHCLLLCHLAGELCWHDWTRNGESGWRDAV